jgi:cytochrome c553
MTRPRERTALVRAIAAHPWLAAVTAVALVVVVGILVVISGLVSIKASSGHLSVTANILDFAKSRSVSTWAETVEAPPLDDQTLVARGAGHYDRACAVCHGAPDVPVATVMAAMTPPPPRLPDALAPYEPEELFYVVKHGIKFTGMPAWPAQQRDDEVWAAVAFLRRMPRIGPGEYRRLARGESTEAAGADVPAVVNDNCRQCHGLDGMSHVPGAFPIIAGQRSEYLYESLLAFATRSRFSGIMTTAVAGLSEATMRGAAEYYASLPSRAAEQRQDSSPIARGATIALRGLPDEDIPACAECHGPTERPKNPTYPRLAGQYPGYLSLQLRLFRERRRGGTPNVTLMEAFVDRLDPEKIRDVSLYYASLSQPPRTTPVLPANK